MHSCYGCCTHPYKSLTGRKNAQTKRQQDPATEEARTNVVVMKLFADLTVNLISVAENCVLAEAQKEILTAELCDFKLL